MFRLTGSPIRRILQKTLISPSRRPLKITGDKDERAKNFGLEICRVNNALDFSNYTKKLEQVLAALVLWKFIELYVLQRMTMDEKKGGQTLRVCRPDKVMNRVYRTSKKGQDELFSTALTRNLVKGFPKDKMTELFEPLRVIVDMMSSARIPTAHSGYSLKTEVMQHPTSKDSGLFGDPHDTASNHALMDARRRAYVTNAMQDAIDKKLNRMEIAAIGVRAAIEYTLNHFTAPVTADDVYPHSQLKKVMNLGKDSSQAKEQLRSREQMKDLHEALGGSLRPAIPNETPAQSLTRPWRRDNTTPLQGDDTLVEPPSPRRAVI